jgi:hypothetical protein
MTVLPSGVLVGPSGNTIVLHSGISKLKNLYHFAMKLKFFSRCCHSTLCKSDYKLPNIVFFLLLLWLGVPQAILLIMATLSCGF